MTLLSFDEKQLAEWRAAVREELRNLSPPYTFALVEEETARQFGAEDAVRAGSMSAFVRTGSMSEPRIARVQAALKHFGLWD